ncbi:MAG: ASCH domain-containing protein [Butyrivibrio sp.]|nr:ASCH domain-containing protein [Butyrivibrio sp.]
MKALIIKEPWIDLILENKKIWEIRGSNTKIRGKIFLIKSGTGQIWGTAELVDSFKVSIVDLKRNPLKHRIPIGAVSEIGYKQAYAWEMKNAKLFDKPIPYKHPKGAVIWVNIDDDFC